MLSTAVLLAASMVVGQADKVEVKLPKEVLSFFSYFVGEWKMEGNSLDGDVKGTNTWKWAPGRHCLTYETVWTDAKGTYRAFAVCGWDSLKSQLVETEYWTGADTTTLRYSKINNTSWEGTMLGVYDGKEIAGKISYQMESPTHLILRASDIKVGGEPRKNVELNYYKK